MSAKNEVKAVLETWWKSRGMSFSGELKWQEPLARYTYYQIGGPAALLLTPKTETDLELISECIGAIGVKYFILGAGSNILVSDRGYDGIVIRAGKMNVEIRRRDLEGPEQNFVEVGGSAMISSFLRRAIQAGWGGLEFLAGIPGTVGGAVKMNAGTHLGETQSRLRKVNAAFLTSPLVWSHFEGEDLKFQYRKNLFLPPEALVWSTLWEITPVEASVVKRQIEETLLRRKQTQPVDYPSCGSVFKNPKESGLSAWQVIDKLGLRGQKIGNAQIAEKHSNFIINLGGAKASEVAALILLVKTRALKEMQIAMQEEVIWVGEK
jgi:UDP-N-acetylmuramate dehydrogenase